MIHGNIQSSLTAQLNEEISYWKNILKRVVAVIKGLASRGLAFRGSNEKFGDQHSGNYIMLLELITEFDPLLTKHIERYANQGSGKTSYLSKTVCDEFIYLMAEKVLIYISDEIKKAKYFSLIVDSTPDAAHVDQLTLVIRYVSDNGEPCERFIKFLPSVGHKAQEMFDAITIELEKLNINFKDCRVARGGIYFLREVRTLEKLMNEIGRGKLLKRVNLTRWSARADACKSLRDSWDEVITVLKITLQRNPSREMRQREFASNQKNLKLRSWSYFGMLFWKG
ncbi:hypothetical protein JTB14_024658 [Gonioctena quinquepunctata]|nr:hypothetical protein JTB14_024658 [Gonioctena quinquepunctata]